MSEPLDARATGSGKISINEGGKPNERAEHLLRNTIDKFGLTRRIEKLEAENARLKQERAVTASQVNEPAQLIIAALQLHGWGEEATTTMNAAIANAIAEHEFRREQQSNKPSEERWER